MTADAPQVRGPGQPQLKVGEVTVRLSTSVPRSLAERVRQYGASQGIVKDAPTLRRILEAFFR